MNSATVPSESRRERARKAKMESILDTAMALVVKGGIEGLTIHGIARELDWAVGALYRYFDSKDALLAELQCCVIAEYYDAMKTTLIRYDADHPEDALGSLVLTARHYDRYLSEHPAHFRLISLALSDSKHHLPDSEGLRVMAVVQPILEHIAQLMGSAQQQATLRQGDPAERTLIYWAGIQGVVQLKKLERFAPQRLNNQRLLSQTMSAFLTAWGVADAEAASTLTRVEEWLK